MALKKYLLPIFSVFAIQTVGPSLSWADVNETHLITGFARTTSPVPGVCNFARPNPADAMKSADDQAAQLCASEQKTATRVSGFSESHNDCVWGGPQYRWAYDTVYEQAAYECR